MNAKECSNYHTIALISHASKIMLKILQAMLQQYVNWELQMYKLSLEKAQEPKIKLPTPAGSQKKAMELKKKSTSAWLTVLKALIVWITTNCGKFLKRWEYPKNLYAGQEARVSTAHGTMDWFKFGKRVLQGYILSPCLFNLSDSVRPHRRQPTRLRHPWDCPGKSTAVDCHFLLQFFVF